MGDLFDLGGRTWIVVGVTKSEGSTFGSEVWAKWSLVSHLFGKDRYTSMVVRTASPQAAKSLAENLTTDFKKAALQATPETEYFSRLNETSKQFMVAIVFVTTIMSIGGIFGVMNTMFAAVSAGSATSVCCAFWVLLAGKCFRCFWQNRCSLRSSVDCLAAAWRRSPTVGPPTASSAEDKVPEENSSRCVS